MTTRRLQWKLTLIVKLSTSPRPFFNKSTVLHTCFDIWPNSIHVEGCFTFAAFPYEQLLSHCDPTIRRWEALISSRPFLWSNIRVFALLVVRFCQIRVTIWISLQRLNSVTILHYAFFIAQLVKR